jgi:hypothetical protein
MQVSLDDIRNKMSEFQVTCLNHILEHYKSNGQWLKTKVLHRILGKTAVISALSSLGGKVVYVSQDTYCLTPLGMLLTQEGNGLEEHLIKFVQYIKERFMEDPEIETISGVEIETYLRIEPSRLNVLKIFVFERMNFISGGSRGEEWSINVPYNVDDLQEKNDLRTYVMQVITNDYDPLFPITEIERLQYILGSQLIKVDNEFDFIENELLKEQLSQDWIEAQLVAKHEAWKSCIILCGGILEGLLVNVLSKDRKKAHETLKKIYEKREQKCRVPSDLYRWTLSDMIDISIETQLISQSTFHVGHALREFRNLVHPGKQVRDNVVVSEEEAEIGLNLVKICLKQFSQDC